jgi:hypothetical protein
MSFMIYIEVFKAYLKYYYYASKNNKIQIYVLILYYIRDECVREICFIKIPEYFRNNILNVIIEKNSRSSLIWSRYLAFSLTVLIKSKL